MALEQAAIGMPGDPVPADLQGALALPGAALTLHLTLGHCRSRTLCSLLSYTMAKLECGVRRAFACAAGLLQPCLAHLPPPPEPLHAAPQTVAQAVSACLHARMALLRRLGRHVPDSPQVTPCIWLGASCLPGSAHHALIPKSQALVPIPMQFQSM